jgi:hypothetical protein
MGFNSVFKGLILMAIQSRDSAEIYIIIY